MKPFGGFIIVQSLWIFKLMEMFQITLLLSLNVLRVFFVFNGLKLRATLGKASWGKQNDCMTAMLSAFRYYALK